MFQKSFSKLNNLKKIYIYIFSWLLLGMLFTLYLAPYISCENEEVLELTTLNSDVVCNRNYIGEEDGIIWLLDSSTYFDMLVGSEYSSVTISVNPDSLVENDFLKVRLAIGTEDKNTFCAADDITKENPSVTLTVPNKLKGDDWARIYIQNGNGRTISLESITFYKETPIYTLKDVIFGYALASVIIVFIATGFYLYNNNRIDRLGTLFYGMISAIVVFYLTCFFSHGQLLSSLFWYSSSNGTYMDFISLLIPISNGINPYYNNGNYPALAYLIIKFFALIIPRESPYIWTVGEYFDSYQSLQAVIVSGVLFEMVPLFISLLVINKKLIKFENEDNKRMFNIFFVISAPIAFTIERGNIIMWALLFTLIFIAYYDSDNKWARELSYISLAIAFAIKIYPAIFGILLLRKKRWFDSIRTALYGAALFVLPFAVFGFRYCINFINGIIGTSTSNLGIGDVGYDISLKNIVRTFVMLFGIDTGSFYRYLWVVIVVALLVVAIFNCSEHIANLAMTLLIIAVPPYSYFYTSIFLFIPFIYYINRYQMDDCKENRFWLVTYIIMFVPLALPLINRLCIGYIVRISYFQLIQYVCILLMEIACLFEAINMLRKKIITLRREK